MPTDRRPEYFKGAQLRVGIIGCGYVGLPLGLRFAEAGHRVTGFDTDPAKVEKLNRGQTYIQHIPQNKIQQFVQSKHFGATTDFSRLAEVDAILICVPTPLDQRREPDLSYVEDTAQAIRPHLQRGPVGGAGIDDLSRNDRRTGAAGAGRDRDEVPGRARSGQRPDRHGFLPGVFARARRSGQQAIRPGANPKGSGRSESSVGTRGRSLYAQIVAKVVPVSSTQAAEMTKLLENIFRCVNIALVNELKMLAMRMGIDIWEVIDAAATKPFGFMPFYPGPGLGGHCIPVDPYYLSWKAREYDFATRFIELAGEVNTAMPYHVVDSVASALNDRQKSLKGSRIMVLGVAYKKDVDDLRESPSLKIIEQLTAARRQSGLQRSAFPGNSQAAPLQLRGNEIGAD